MKKILITVTVLFCFFAGIAQTTVTIACIGGASCLNPEPEVSTSYTFTLVNPPSSYAVNSIEWLPTGQSSTGPKNRAFYDATWPNTPSSAIKKLQVKVRLTVGTSEITVISPEVPITVKHIAAIPSITISGSGGVSGTFSNNATVAVPCGSRALTLTAPIPFTNPNANVTYEWLIPSGWSGSSNTNTINLTSNAGTTDVVVTLRYRRTDSNLFLQFFSLNMSRPKVGTPSISTVSGSLTCIGTSATLSASAANATNYTWSSTGNVSVSPTNGATTTATVSGNGNATITVRADNGCQSPTSTTSNRAVGTPTFYSITPPNSFNYINGNTILSVQADQPCPAYYWRIFGGSGYINPTSGPCSYTYGSTTYNKFNTCYVSTSDFVRVELSSANACGVGQTHTFYLQNGSGYRMTSPNPATSTVSLEFTSEFSVENLKSVDLIRDSDLRTSRTFNPTNNQQNAAFQSSRAVSFDVTNLPKGKYYVQVMYADGKKFSEKILLQ